MISRQKGPSQSDSDKFTSQGSTDYQWLKAPKRQVSVSGTWIPLYRKRVFEDVTKSTILPGSCFTSIMERCGQTEHTEEHVRRVREGYEGYSHNPRECWEEERNMAQFTPWLQHRNDFGLLAPARSEWTGCFFLKPLSMLILYHITLKKLDSSWCHTGQTQWTQAIFNLQLLFLKKSLVLVLLFNPPQSGAHTQGTHMQGKLCATEHLLIPTALPPLHTTSGATPTHQVQVLRRGHRNVNKSDVIILCFVPGIRVSTSTTMTGVNTLDLKQRPMESSSQSLRQTGRQKERHTHMHTRMHAYTSPKQSRMNLNFPSGFSTVLQMEPSV